MATQNFTVPDTCNDTVSKLYNIQTSLVNITSDNLYTLRYFCAKGHAAEENDKYSKPLVWIGVYMAVASLVCIPAMVADFLHGLRNECYQIPSKYTSLNVPSMMLIAIAIKLLVDISGSMPGEIEQLAKVGSIAFMCTIMAIFNPSLASMNNKTLLSNIIGLAIFVITIAVNLIIQITTGVIKNIGGQRLSIKRDRFYMFKIYYRLSYTAKAIQYTVIMIFMLLISISTAIIIPSLKKHLEFQYQVRRKALNDQQQLQHTRIPTVKELTEHVTKYWVMAKTGNPQFVVARNCLSYVYLALFWYSVFIYMYELPKSLIQGLALRNYKSDYEWSIPIILIAQFIGIVIGSSIVICRCMKSLLFFKYSWNHVLLYDLVNNRYKEYWTEKLYEWKGSHTGFLSSFPRSTRIFVHFMKECVLSLCIGHQRVLVGATCLLLAFCSKSVLLFIIIFYEALKSANQTTMISDALETATPVVSRNNDLVNYALHLDDEVQPSQKVVENIVESMNRLIKRAEKQQNNNLLELLGKSNGFEGVENFDDIDQNFGFDPLPPSVKLNSWSVPVITLSCIAISVPDISKNQVDSLIKSIDQALLYTHHVEESFNSGHAFVNIRKTSMTLWYEVKDKLKWLGNPIGEGACGQLPRQILASFADKAEAILGETKTGSNTKKQMISFPYIAAHSMHRISHSILSKYTYEIQRNESFFELLSSMIADILLACFFNIPRVIMMKCHSDEIEKREENVEAAAELLGRSTKLIRKLEACDLPTIDPEKMGYIDEWRLYLKQSSFP